MRSPSGSIPRSTRRVRRPAFEVVGAIRDGQATLTGPKAILKTLIKRLTG